MELVLLCCVQQLYGPEVNTDDKPGWQVTCVVHNHAYCMSVMRLISHFGKAGDEVHGMNRAQMCLPGFRPTANEYGIASCPGQWFLCLRDRPWRECVPTYLMDGIEITCEKGCEASTRSTCCYWWKDAAEMAYLHCRNPFLWVTGKRFTKRTQNGTERHGRVVKTLASHSGRSQIQISVRTQLSWVFRGFPQSLQENAGIVP
jgi:hypothetical protein